MPLTFSALSAVLDAGVIGVIGIIGVGFASGCVVSDDGAFFKTLLALDVCGNGVGKTCVEE